MRSYARKVVRIPTWCHQFGGNAGVHPTRAQNERGWNADVRHVLSLGLTEIMVYCAGSPSFSFFFGRMECCLYLRGDNNGEEPWKRWKWKMNNMRPSTHTNRPGWNLDLKWKIWEMIQKTWHGCIESWWNLNIQLHSIDTGMMQWENRQNTTPKT